MTEIVKVQLALGSTSADPPALVYDRDRHHTQYMKVAPELAAKMGDEKKAYFNAEWSNGWTIGDRVEDQPW